ncbi:LysR family transcriptional regulator [Chitinasiproducens palmae]|uniref:DNA-binding transcriptional regulator, LysR family n=1 Tax=Chitinasiproducens palmae TaxID=1770053 RepID=A0A1H2PNY1_9BURK|nr:LysR family transcriptional regulator [Chitinasiproducens palmae]SDV48321.1 DNA-binding transcriptional regulator, LysR family [Chitinasiproducens palmae]
MQLEDLRLFVATVDAGSFTAAAEKLGLSKQYVSRRTMALEAEMGARLLNRTTRRLQATELGMTFYGRAMRILAEVAETQEVMANQGATPRGILRISAPMTFGTMHLSPRLPEFLRRHPQVQIELDLNDRAVDLVAEGYDMAIRIGILPDSTLIARRICAVRTVCCASPAYLARHAPPTAPDALAEHACLLYGHAKHVEWPFQRDGRRVVVPLRGQLRANNGEVIRDAAIAGLGIAMLPTFIIDEALARGDLLPVLDGWRVPDGAVHAVYPQHRQSSRLLQAFVDFLREALDDD